MNDDHENFAGEEPGLSIVVPACNEALAIGSTVHGLRTMAEQLDMPVEILVVDDGSTDRTGDIAAEAGAKVLPHPHRGGYGRALKTGITHARYEQIAIIDADATYPIDQLPTLVRFSENHDMVVGARTGAHYRRSLLRSPIRSTFLMLANFVTGKHIPDPNSGMRIFKRSQVMPRFSQLPKGFSFTTTITMILTLEGYFVHYHPITYGNRTGTSKIKFLPDTLRLAQTLFEVTLRHNPLKAFLLVSLVPALIGVGCIVGDPSGGWHAASSYLIAALIVFAIGMAAVVLRKGNPL
jgi:glycosyltransferase involved in cell wall biosynthesis